MSSVARKRAITINSLFGLQLVSINAERNSRLLYTENIRFELSVSEAASGESDDFDSFSGFDGFVDLDRFDDFDIDDMFSECEFIKNMLF